MRRPTDPDESGRRATTIKRRSTSQFLGPPFLGRWVHLHRDIELKSSEPHTWAQVASRLESPPAKLLTAKEVPEGGQ